MRVAAAQHGVVSRDQMRRLGFSEKAIDHSLRSGRAHRVLRGVYALGQPSTERGHLMAAALACGDGAVLSHRSAGALLGLLDKVPSSSM